MRYITKMQLNYQNEVHMNGFNVCGGSLYETAAFSLCGCMHYNWVSMKNQLSFMRVLFSIKNKTKRVGDGGREMRLRSAFPQTFAGCLLVSISTVFFLTEIILIIIRVVFFFFLVTHHQRFWISIIDNCLRNEKRSMETWGETPTNFKQSSPTSLNHFSLAFQTHPFPYTPNPPIPTW